MFIVLLVMGCLGVVTGMVAKSKGRSFASWWIYGTLLFIVALPHALLLRPMAEKIGMRTCPHCAELIRQEALVCRYCGRDMPVSRTVAGIVLEE